MKSGVNFQPKPEDDHYVTIHRSYKQITDGSASTAALLSVLEFLAESTWTSTDFSTDSLPDRVEISKNCNTPLLMHLLDGLIKKSALLAKLQLLESKKFISMRVEKGRFRVITYNRREIAQALSEIDRPKSERSKSERLKSERSMPFDRPKSEHSTPQKVNTTIHITNQERTNQEDVCKNGHGYSKTKSYHPGLTPYQGSTEFMEERPWILKWRRANPVYVSAFLDYIITRLNKTETYKLGATTADAVGYVGKVNANSPEQTDTERLQRLNALWNEWQAQRDDKAGIAPKDGRPMLTADQLQQLASIDFIDLTAEEAMLLDPSFKVDVTPDWQNNVRVLS